ncbi:EAL domain-containing protein [Luteimonas sp. 3794]|uniref:sensor domain-containing protein n=1 Tax=Luteimonas sp. 3794 TaxID=2817730 RepID=UPI002863A8CC|nr:EAL domain-containing protein [Luteimonas sp. 3794]MDR6993351.1 diguanylate cyclase (GGDEF)-like protein/PAS domain S-box-containing protein [Luteimonas sp. 3794]
MTHPSDTGNTGLLERQAHALALPDALSLAADDRNLPADVRALLSRARDALAATRAEADAAGLRYHALFDAVPDPVSILDAEGIVLDLNRAGEQAYGRPRADIVGQPIEVLNPDLPRDHLAPVWDAVHRGRTYVIEVTNMRGDGSRFPVEVHTAGFEHDGQPCLVAVARDLSERREAEVRYRELMDVMDRGIAIHDVAGRFVYGNPAALRLLGIRQGTSLGDTSNLGEWLAIAPDGNEMPWAELPPVRALRDGRIVESTLVGLYHRMRRELYWLTVTAVPQYPPGGDRPHQVLSLFSDVSALKRDSAMFDRVQALAHIGGWELDCGTDRLYLTAEAVHILDPTQPPTTMEALIGLLLLPDRTRLRDALGAAMVDAAGFDIELQGMRSDGGTFWVRAIGGPRQGDPATSRLTGTLQDIARDKHDEAILRAQARTDPLTGLLNRDAILCELDARMADPARAGVAVLYIDLDRFKFVNDALGHAAGDELLIAAAHRIGQAVGSSGSIARFGGDEFLVVCDAGAGASHAERVASAILDAFGDGFRFDTEEFSITASIGIARAPDDGDRPQTLIQNADAAMYESKRRIRNGWQLFTPALAQTQQDRLRVETHLRRAIDNDEFHLVYQPQVDLRSRRVIAAEALIRWRNRQLGEMRPDHFIDHAESTGDIVRIGAWVLREACRQTAAWRDAGLGVVRVAVNVSYRQFLGDELAAHVHDVLAEFALPGSALELEFTERVLIEDAPDTLRTFAALRDMGVQLSIDDFGEGYSGLNYLRRLPIHGLKLSQLFVGGVPGDRSDVAVCQAVAGIARSLGLGLVAEGIESEAQRRFLLDLGVTVGQGFLFAPGLSPDEFSRRLHGGPGPPA